MNTHPNPPTELSRIARVRIPTVASATFAFEDATHERFDVHSHVVDAEEARLANIARVMAKAMLDLEPFVRALDVAARGCDRRGLPVHAKPFVAAQLDEYAIVEAVIGDRLTNEAETLLKLLFKQALAGPRPTIEAAIPFEVGQ